MKRLFKNKVLAFVIVLMMIASTFPMGIFSVSATTVQGTAITDAAGFAAMESDGTYYLAESITLTETYSQQFTGKFNGNGQTITASAPIFDQVMDATLENFKVVSQDDAVVTLADGGGMVCNKAGGNTTLRNITNTVSLKSTNSTDKHSLAGIVGDFVAGTENSTVIIDGCVNEGNINANTSVGIAGGIVGGSNHGSGAYNVSIENCSNSGNIGAMKCGGIICLFDKLTGSVTIKNCQNSGKVAAKKDLAGGIVSQVTSSISNLKIENCVNSGEVNISTDKYAGGIIGYCQMSGNSTNVQISHCYNSGNIKVVETKTGAYVSGIAGRIAGGLIEYCGNSGTIYGGGYTAGIVGRANGGSGATIRYCYNAGNVSGLGCCAGILSNRLANDIYGCYNKGVIAYIEGSTSTVAIAQIAGVGNDKYYDNYYLEGMDIPAFPAESNAVTAYNAADLASGKLAYDMNKAIGETVYYQNINANDENKDAFPVLDATHGYVFKNGEDVYSLRFHTLETASIRLSSDNAQRGMRFATAVNKADYDNLPSDVKESISFGTLITPDSYLKVAQGGGYEFTKSGLANLDTDKPYMSIETSEFIEELKGADNSTYYYFCGSITGIKADNYQWDYSAIGYISIGEIEIYSTEYATRNIAYVANAALNDPEGGYTDEEIDMIRGYLPQN